MRPRLFAAEIHTSEGFCPCHERASMRPRLFAAEIRAVRAVFCAVRMASMRPRLFAAEIEVRGRGQGGRVYSFNEAAAFRRGNHRPWWPSAPRQRGFNEAAAFRRGNRGSQRTSWTARTCFNEAAAFRRGNRLKVTSYTLHARMASMRPRLFAAEIQPSRVRKAHSARVASMRPRLFAAEIFVRSVLMDAESHLLQ